MCAMHSDSPHPYPLIMPPFLSAPLIPHKLLSIVLTFYLISQDCVCDLVFKQFLGAHWAPHCIFFNSSVYVNFLMEAMKMLHKTRVPPLATLFKCLGFKTRLTFSLLMRKRWKRMLSPSLAVHSLVVTVRNKLIWGRIASLLLHDSRTVGVFP